MIVCFGHLGLGMMTKSTKNYFFRRTSKMQILFQLTLAALVLFSFVMVVGVPVAYAIPQYWSQAKPLLFVGSGIWLLLVIVVAVLNIFVI